MTDMASPAMESAAEIEYWCFISYRHADDYEQDRNWASWLHEEIERYEVPAEFVGTTNRRGDVVPERIYPVFRDEVSLAANADLASSITDALDRSRYLVVLCSPRAVESRYVAEEIAHFRRSGQEERILAVILDGEPGDPARECFPAPLRHGLDAAGEIDPDRPVEPIAADFRLPDGRQGFTSGEAYRRALIDGGQDRRTVDAAAEAFELNLQLMKLKVLAGILGLPLESLRDRDKAYQLERARHRARVLRRWLTAVGVLALLVLAAGFLANQQRGRAEERGAIALSRQLAAQAVSLSGTEQGDLGLLLSLEAYRARPTVEARSSILTGLNRDPTILSYLHGHMREITSLAFSADGARLLSLGCEGINTLNLCRHFGIREWDVASSEQVNQLLLAEASRWSQAAYGMDETSILVSGSDNPVVVWDLAAGSQSGHFRGARYPATTRLVRYPGQPLLAATRLSGGTVDIWDATTESAPLYSLRHEGTQGGIRVLTFHPDGRRIATGGEDGSVRIWEFPSAEGEPRLAGPTLEGHSLDVIDLAFSPDGRFLVSASWDDSVALWDADTRERLLTLVSGLDIAGVTFSPDGTQLIVGVSIGETGGELLVVDTNTWRVTGSLAGKWPVAFQHGGDVVASAGANGTIILRDLSRTQALARTLETNLEIVTLAIAPEGDTLAGGTRDGNIQLWNLTTAARKGTPLVGHTREVKALAFQPTGSLLASGGADQRILLWDLNASPTERPRELVGHTSSIFALAFSEDGTQLASGSFDKTVRLWDVASGDLVVLPITTGVDVYAVTFDMEGERLAAATEDGSVLMWDLTEELYPMRLVGTHLMESDGMSGLAFVGSGDVLISSSREETMRWDLLAETARAPIRGNFAAVNGAGDLAAIGTDDNHIVLVDVSSWQAFGEPLGKHEDYITAIAFVPGGSILATTGAEGRLFLWDVSIESWTRLACQIARRNLSTEEWTRFMGDLEYHTTCPDAQEPSRHPLDAERALALGVQAAKVGDDAEATRLLGLAATLVQETSSAELSYEICWSGALYGSAPQVVSACDYAVALEPESARYRDSRGLVRALLGDTESAIEDFLYYIERTDGHQRLAERRTRRQRWVEQLEEGQDPFNDLTIFQLRNEAWRF